MVFGVATIPESFAGLIGSSTQPRRPSVKWNLGSNFESVAKEPTASGADFRLERLDSQPDLGLCVQPQIYYPAAAAGNSEVVIQVWFWCAERSSDPGRLRESELSDPHLPSRVPHPRPSEFLRLQTQANP